MTVPVAQEYSPSYSVASNTAVLALLVAEGSSGCSLKVYDVSDVLLLSYTLTDPPGAVDGTSGQLTVTTTGLVVGTVPGTAAYCEINDALGAWITRIPCIESESPVPGLLALSNLVIVSGAEVTISSITLD